MSADSAHFLSSLPAPQAFGGSPGFFSVIAEMKNPADYNKAMFLAQGVSMSLYITVSTVLWCEYKLGRVSSFYGLSPLNPPPPPPLLPFGSSRSVFCGVYVTSPALGSAGPLIKKIAYGE